MLEALVGKVMLHIFINTTLTQILLSHWQFLQLKKTVLQTKLPRWGLCFSGSWQLVYYVYVYEGCRVVI